MHLTNHRYVISVSKASHLKPDYQRASATKAQRQRCYFYSDGESAVFFVFFFVKQRQAGGGGKMKPLAAALKVRMDRIDSVVIMTREDALRRLADGGWGAVGA